MSTVESTKLAGRPWPDGDPATWLYVDELPTPPEVAAEVERVCRQMGWWPRWWWRRHIRSKTTFLKCMHYFLDKQVIYRQTPRGMLVLRVDEPGSDGNDAFRVAAAARGEKNVVQTFYDLSKVRDWHHVWGNLDEA